MTWDLLGILLLQSIRHPIMDAIALFFAYLFSSTVLLIFSIFLLILFILKKNARLFLIPFAMGLVMIFVKILKDVFARARPDLAISMPMLPYSHYSFPSGHTAAAFLLAVLLSKQYPKYKILFYTVAVITGLSRLYLGLHYLSDILASIAIGLGIGFVCLYKEKQIQHLGEKVIKFTNSFQKLWQH